jgi:homoaconitase/3-isopropylmalate dehydratase large subunit
MTKVSGTKKITQNTELKQTAVSNMSMLNNITLSNMSILNNIKLVLGKFGYTFTYKQVREGKTRVSAYEFNKIKAIETYINNQQKNKEKREKQKEELDF